MLNEKTDHSIAISSIFCIGMVYFRCPLVNPHAQAVQNMCGKGYFRPSYGRSKFTLFSKKKQTKMRCSKKQARPQFSKYRFQIRSF